MCSSRMDTGVTVLTSRFIVLNNDTVICDECYEPQFPEVDPGLVPFAHIQHGTCSTCGKETDASPTS